MSVAYGLLRASLRLMTYIIVVAKTVLCDYRYEKPNMQEGRSTLND